MRVKAISETQIYITLPCPVPCLVASDGGQGYSRHILLCPRLIQTIV